jgi:hypothetical protein
MSLSRRAMLISLAGLPALSGSPVSAASNLPKGLDTDADGTVDLTEAKTAAETLFDKLDHDHDGTLDAKELRRRLSEGDLTKADLDKDGTLSKDEYLAVVEKRFDAADVDHDGTLDAKELRGSSGRALLKLLQ